jgi:hypothetical protein
MKLRFFRGIAVQSSLLPTVEREISERGLLSGSGRWLMDFPDIAAIRTHQSTLLQDLDVDPRERFAGSAVGICATGCRAGATYYALKHNSAPGHEPLLIEFEAPVSDVYVDGRDFLYTAFQLWDSHSEESVHEQHRAIARVFGRRCAELFLLVTKETDQRKRINLATLAVTDENVVREHYKNTIPLGGRSKTEFSSAFIVRGPVPGSNVLSVSTPSPSDLKGPVLQLRTFLCAPGQPPLESVLAQV